MPVYSAELVYAVHAHDSTGQRCGYMKHDDVVVECRFRDWIYTDSQIKLLDGVKVTACCA